MSMKVLPKYKVLLNKNHSTDAQRAWVPHPQGSEIKHESVSFLSLFPRSIPSTLRSHLLKVPVSHIQIVIVSAGGKVKLPREFRIQRVPEAPINSSHFRASSVSERLWKASTIMGLHRVGRGGPCMCSHVENITQILPHQRCSLLLDISSSH